MTPHWPLHGLSLCTPELELRPVTEADLPGLAVQLSVDLEVDPTATRYDGLSDADNRALALHQGYWRSVGTWRPESWALPFAVRHGDDVVGSQTLEGEDFPRLRTVDSASWLAPEARGRGWGVQARAAILALAFGPLGATAAVTSAWHDNGASLGVSRSLGYQPNGVTTHWRGDRPDEMVHLRLTREQWRDSPWRDRVEVRGFEPCRPFFGL
ncbi:Protein N-acetyltransferase, RimJ/RimL family [Pedococcus cremeus]|uniref:Protein N-acetyltransferase, RimJ/RimL family n=1 Tax=Pedococcus cremeus TaxID=587636 RepID=A0A1H9UZE8_9MICO|nr:GNAT family N-acetyltransferase [Pedococcus cremeus]SES14865.1 Protein N-acetyltransferase, RimJ/RimL family [Pedococcus cremeus]